MPRRRWAGAEPTADLRLLLTGGAGFIGSNFVRHLARQRPSWTITVLDALTYAGNRVNLEHVLDGRRVRLVQGRIEDTRLVRELMAGADAVVHLAAETHVDRSIHDATPFLRTNVVGTHVLLEAARTEAVARFLHVSTDEVYGSLGERGSFTEESPLTPRSPYAASKAAADLLIQAYVHTYDFPAVTVRPSNTYGPFQYAEKFLPVLLTNALDRRPLPVYGEGKNVRDWLWVEDLCRGMEAALLQGDQGEVYNLAGGQERSNLQVARQVLDALGKPDSSITFVTDRPGHDFRYALDCEKARRQLGWGPTVGFEVGLERLIAWYRENESWWRSQKSGLEKWSRGFWDAEVSGGAEVSSGADVPTSSAGTGG
jgi:dTDP-glucose 4,6-dehydratase